MVLQRVGELEATAVQVLRPAYQARPLIMAAVGVLVVLLEQEQPATVEEMGLLAELVRQELQIRVVVVAGQGQEMALTVVQVS